MSPVDNDDVDVHTVCCRTGLYIEWGQKTVQCPLLGGYFLLPSLLPLGRHCGGKDVRLAEGSWWYLLCCCKVWVERGEALGRCLVRQQDRHSEQWPHSPSGSLCRCSSGHPSLHSYTGGVGTGSRRLNAMNTGRHRERKSSWGTSTLPVPLLQRVSFTAGKAVKERWQCSHFCQLGRPSCGVATLKCCLLWRALRRRQLATPLAIPQTAWAGDEHYCCLQPSTDLIKRQWGSVRCRQMHSTHHTKHIVLFFADFLLPTSNIHYIRLLYFWTLALWFWGHVSSVLNLLYA